MITDGPLPGSAGSALHGPRSPAWFTATFQRLAALSGNGQEFEVPAAERVREFDLGFEDLVKRGEAHELTVLERFRMDGRSITEISQRPDADAEAAQATLEAIRNGTDVIYQGVLLGASPDGGTALLGRPDFLVRADLLAAPDGEPRPDQLHYEVVDAKLARTAKACAVAQTAFYSHLLAALQGVRPRWMQLALGQGELVPLKVGDYAAYERQARRALGPLIAADVRTLSALDLADEPDALGGLTGGDVIGQVKRSVVWRFSFPPQEYRFKRGVTRPRIGQRADRGNPYLHPDPAGLEHGELESRLRDGDLDIAAGTAWLWAREQFQGTVDTLFVDEAGQMSLANILAVAGAARNLVLIGDPQQLAQPSQAAHPPGAGVSALEHILGDHATVPPDAGLLLDQTWRMHPRLCRFTSETFYDGKLTYAEGLERQEILGDVALRGSGLRVVEVTHEGNTKDGGRRSGRVLRRPCINFGILAALASSRKIVLCVTNLTLGTVRPA